MDGTIYMIRMDQDGPVKIGFTAHHPEKRLRQLQTGNPRKLCVVECFGGTVEGEGLFHKAFQSQRLEGEWFTWSEALYESFIHVAVFGGGFPTIPPLTKPGCDLLRHNHEVNGARRRYPDGRRHSQINWDELAVQCGVDAAAFVEWEASR